MDQKNFKLILDLIETQGLTFKQWRTLFFKLQQKPQRKEKSQ